jgi:hypothetical protein
MSWVLSANLDSLHNNWHGAEIPRTEKAISPRKKPWKCRPMGSMESHMPVFHASHTPYAHSHGYGDDYHVSEDRQGPPKNSSAKAGRNYVGRRKCNRIKSNLARGFKP